MIVYSLTSESDLRYLAVMITEQTEWNNISIDITGLTGSEYGVSVFSLENGLPFPRVVTTPRTVIVAPSSDQGLYISNPYTESDSGMIYILTVAERAQSPLPPIEYEIRSSDSGSVACIKCAFNDNSLKDCVAVVHQRISQLSSNGLMNIESSHKFNKSGDTAYGCIDGVNLEQYQVGVLGGSEVQKNNAQ